MIIKTTRKIFTFIILIMLASSSVSMAKTLRYATSWPEGSIGANAGYSYADAVKDYSNGNLEVKVYPMSLLSAEEASSGTRDGLADIGFVFAGYFPAEYPHTNFLNETSMQLHSFPSDLTKDGRGVFAFQGAITEFLLFNCDSCLNEYLQQNQVYTSNAAASMYGLLCTKKTTNLSELKGRRLRVAGSNWARWASAFEARSVSLTINDLVESLNQGIVDCSVSSAPELLNLRLIDVVSDITMDVPGGLFAGASATNINRDTWRKLKKSDREALIRAGAVMTAEVPWEYVRQERIALEEAKNKGIKIHNASSEFISETAEFAKKDLETIVAYYKKNHNINNAETLLAEFKKTVLRWIELVQNVQSKEDLQKLYWDEIFSRVNVDTYGMN